MGRSSKKSKESREQRKQEIAQIAASQALVKEAKNQDDPLSAIPAFRQFEKDGVSASLDFCRAPSLDEATTAAIWELMVKNMKQVYEQCEWGWKETVKREELFDEASCFLLAHAADGSLLAFSHFRFDVDNRRPVLYCYELQLSESTRRQGLGRRMMQMLELLAWRANMQCVVLTVLKHNQDACAFFHAMKYELDETSPADCYEETYCYEILSKQRKVQSVPPPHGHVMHKVTAAAHHKCGGHKCC